MGYKLTIALIWLALPLAALLLLRADYERYQSELSSQLEYAILRRDHLLRYSNLYDNRRREIGGIYDPRTRSMWEKRFTELKQQQEGEEAALGNASLSHYPMVRDIMDDASELLAQQRDNIRDSARLQDRYIKASVGFEDMDDEIFFWQGYARQARMFGAWEAYMIYQNRIAVLEDQRNRRQHQRLSLSNEINISSGQANTFKTELHRMLATLPDRIALDQGRTYREDLQQRFGNFDLRSTVKQLVSGTKPARAAN
ncbi:MAG: hypothetical protein M3R04_08265 [bacterium]|nr:hypothetical protein [bacterium]